MASPPPSARVFVGSGSLSPFGFPHTRVTLGILPNHGPSCVRACVCAEMMREPKRRAKVCTISPPRQPHFSHMPHTPFPHISELNSVFKVSRWMSGPMLRTFNAWRRHVSDRIREKRLLLEAHPLLPICRTPFPPDVRNEFDCFFLARSDFYWRQPPFSPYVAPRFPHMSEINTIFLFFCTPFPHMSRPVSPHMSEINSLFSVCLEGVRCPA